MARKAYRLTVTIDLPNIGVAIYRFIGRYPQEMWNAYYSHRDADPFFAGHADTGAFKPEEVDVDTGEGRAFVSAIVPPPGHTLPPI